VKSSSLLLELAVLLLLLLLMLLLLLLLLLHLALVLLVLGVQRMQVERFVVLIFNETRQRSRMRNIRLQQLVMLGGWIVGCQGSTMNNCLFILLSAFEDQRKFVQFKKKK
jgi:hypothetical protein